MSYNGFFKETIPAELDYMAVNENERIILWGSCKRNCRELSVENIRNHLVGLYSSRPVVPYLSYTHEFVLFSPDIDKLTENRLSREIDELPDKWEFNSNEVSGIISNFFQQTVVVPTGLEFNLSKKKRFVKMQDLLQD